jgi:uncharacterized repeat protein (TIGR03803 family)
MAYNQWAEFTASLKENLMRVALAWDRLRLSTFFALGFLALLLMLAGNIAGQVQYNVLYSFCSATNCTDGGAPHGKLVSDRSGRVYGTTAAGGAYQEGTVFQLSPSNGAWTEAVLYSFCVNDVENCPDGGEPMAGPTFDNVGNLYGTTEGGGAYGLGSVFELTPPSDPGGAWTETVLWSFGATGDGQTPVSRLIFDASGNLYGTTSGGGAYGGGTVFELVSAGGGRWSENILFSFGADPFNGYSPEAAVAFDKSGNLYGTTFEGGAHDNAGWGVAYELSPNPQPPWTETVLFRFRKGTGANPRSALDFDSLGNIYGTLSSWGVNGGGGVFRLTPQGRENTVLFTGPPDGAGPVAGVSVVGSALYGTTMMGGSQNLGTLFRMRPKTKTILYNFCSLPGCADGYYPEAALILLGKSLLGTAEAGGANGKGGVVFEISEAAPGHAKGPSAKSGHPANPRPVAAASQ